MDHQNYDVDSTTTEWIKKSSVDSSSNIDYSSRMDPNEIPTVNSTNPNYHPSSTNNTHQWDKNSSVNDANIDKVKGDLKKGQQQVEDIITKSKRILGQQCKCERIMRTIESRRSDYLSLRQTARARVTLI